MVEAMSARLASSWSRNGKSVPATETLFRGATVVRRVYVAHFKSCPFPGKAARSKGGDAPLVGDLRQRIGLVHELRQLARAEELFDRRGDRFGVDQVMRHEVLGLRLRQPLLDGALDAHQARAELVLRELADRAYAPVAEVVDVVDLPAAVAQLDQDAHDRENIVVGQRALTLRPLRARARVEAAQPS